jgi:hypothetical protein
MVYLSELKKFINMVILSEKYQWRSIRLLTITELLLTTEEMQSKSQNKWNGKVKGKVVPLLN